MSANTRIRPGRFAKALPKVLSFRSRRRLMVTCGWARNLGWFASMVLGPLHGRRQPANNSQAPGSKLFWLRETVLFGLAQRRALPVGRMAISPDIRKLPGTSLLHCCKMPKERFGLESGTPAGSVPSEPTRRSATDPGASAGLYLACTRTTKAIYGPRLKRVSGDGCLVLQCTTRFPVARLRRRR